MLQAAGLAQDTLDVLQQQGWEAYRKLRRGVRKSVAVKPRSLLQLGRRTPSSQARSEGSQPGADAGPTAVAEGDAAAVVLEAVEVARCVEQGAAAAVVTATDGVHGPHPHHPVRETQRAASNLCAVHEWHCVATENVPEIHVPCSRGLLACELCCGWPRRRWAAAAGRRIWERCIAPEALSSRTGRSWPLVRIREHVKF